MSTAMLIFLIHFVADFCLQTEWMALGKSKYWSPLLAHIATYTAVCLLISPLFLPFWVAILWSVTNGLCHLVVDYFSSRAMRRAREAGNNSRFFLLLGFDQLCHAWCLLGILGLLA
jgi:hypothetical protein